MACNKAGPRLWEPLKPRGHQGSISASASSLQFQSPEGQSPATEGGAGPACLRCPWGRSVREGDPGLLPQPPLQGRAHQFYQHVTLLGGCPRGLKRTLNNDRPVINHRGVSTPHPGKPRPIPAGKYLTGSASGGLPIPGVQDPP